MGNNREAFEKKYPFFAYVHIWNQIEIKHWIIRNHYGKIAFFFFGSISIIIVWRILGAVYVNFV